MKKAVSMVLTAAMAMSCVIFANAASDSRMSVAENGDVVYDYDGFSVVISDSLVMQSRASVTESDSGVATSDDPAIYDLGFPNGKYTNAYVWIENIDAENRLQFTIEGTVNGEPIAIEVTNMEPDDYRNVTFKADTGYTLNGAVDIIIEPYRADSVEYDYNSGKS